MDRTASRLAAATGLSLLATGLGLTVVGLDAAAAATCAAKITITGPSHGHLVLSPSGVKDQVGNCVELLNSTQSKVTVTISQGDKTVYSGGLAKGAAGSFTPHAVGQDTVSASSQVLLLKFTGSGSITATAAPTPGPSKSPTPKPTSKHSTPPSKKPVVALKPGKPGSGNRKHHGAGNQKTPTPHATGIKLPPLPPLPSVGVTSLPKGSKPLVAPGLPATGVAPSTTSPSSSPVAAVIGGPIEPLDSNRRGLPVAIGVLVVLGIATGWGRVLLATAGPGDNRRKRAHAV